MNTLFDIYERHIAEWYIKKLQSRLIYFFNPFCSHGQFLRRNFVKHWVLIFYQRPKLIPFCLKHSKLNHVQSGLISIWIKTYTYTWEFDIPSEYLSRTWCIPGNRTLLSWYQTRHWTSRRRPLPILRYRYLFLLFLPTALHKINTKKHNNTSYMSK